MKKKIISALVMGIIILCSPIVFTQCSAFKTANKVANSINNISDMILNYDSMAKHYISVANKAKKGDIMAIVEAGDLLSKAVDYKKQLDKLMPNMTTTQKRQVKNIESNILKMAQSLIK